MPRNAVGFEIVKHIIRSAGSVGSNYRASVRAKSTNDFIYKIEIVLEEADELTAILPQQTKLRKQLKMLLRIDNVYMPFVYRRTFKTLHSYTDK